MGSSDRTGEGGIFNYLLLLRRWLLHFRQRVTFEPTYLPLYPTWHDTSSLQRGSGIENNHRAIPLSVTPERLPPLVELPHPALLVELLFLPALLVLPFSPRTALPSYFARRVSSLLRHTQAMSQVGMSSSGRRPVADPLVGEETGLPLIQCPFCNRVRVIERWMQQDSVNYGRIYIKCSRNDRWVSLILDL